MSRDILDIVGLDQEAEEVRGALQDAHEAQRLMDTLIESRERQRISQVQVAERMETTQSAVSKFERAGGDPRLSTLQRYARAINARMHLNISIDGGNWEESGRIVRPMHAEDLSVDDAAIDAQWTPIGEKKVG